MSIFWHFARKMLRYRRLMGVMVAAALLDAACAMGGLASLMWIIQILFGEVDDEMARPTVRGLVERWLGRDSLTAWVGDQTHLAQWVPAGHFGGFAFMLGVILVLAIIGSVMRYIYQTAAITIGLYTVARIRKLAFHRLVHGPMEVTFAHGTADNLSRIARDCNQLAQGFNVLMAKSLRGLLMGVVAMILAVVANWQMTLIFLVAMPLIGVSLKQFGRRIRKASRIANQAYGQMIGSLQEAMQGIMVVKVHNAEGYERRRFHRINRYVLQQEMRARTARALSSPAVELIALVGVMGVALVAAYLVFVQQNSDPAEMLTVLAMLGFAGANLKPLANLNNDLQESAAAAMRVDEILHLPVEPGARGVPDLKPLLPRHQQEIRFEAVTYRYPRSEENVLHGIDLVVPFGQTVAIVGTNGAGKTTLLSMISRLVEPTTGRVLIDGRDLRDHGLRSIRKQMAVVSQQTVLFAGSIAENIAYGQRHVNLERIQAAARLAHADQFIADLPEGYHTQLGEGGMGLSGGQRQRIAIARAILRDPTILILDEATSQIDADSEARITEALKHFQQGRTTFVIAHRLSTVVDADRIIVMAAGRIIDSGRHSELLERCELYQTLTRTQL